MLENPKEMNATTQLETVNVKAKKVHLFACNLVKFAVCLTANKTKELAKWIISSRAYVENRSVKFAERLNYCGNSESLLARGENQESLISVLCAIKNKPINGIWNAKQQSRQKKDSTLMNCQETGAKITLKKAKRFLLKTIINRATEIESWFMLTMVINASVAAKENGDSLLSIMSTMMDISKGKKVFTQMVHNFTDGLCKITSQAIIEFFALTVILEGHEIKVSVPTGKVQRLSLRRVQSSDWKRPLPLGVMI
jgi:hypothetical protein